MGDQSIRSGPWRLDVIRPKDSGEEGEEWYPDGLSDCAVRGRRQPESRPGFGWPDPALFGRDVPGLDGRVVAAILASESAQTKEMPTKPRMRCVDSQT